MNNKNYDISFDWDGFIFICRNNEKYYKQLFIIGKGWSRLISIPKKEYMLAARDRARIFK